MGASGMSRLWRAAKLQSAPSADNPRYATDTGNRVSGHIKLNKNLY